MQVTSQEIPNTPENANVIRVSFFPADRKAVVDAVNVVGPKGAVDHFIKNGCSPSYVKVFVRHVIKYGL